MYRVVISGSRSGHRIDQSLCSSIARQESAAKKLFKFCMTRGTLVIYELEGGFHEWVEAGKPFEKND